MQCFLVCICHVTQRHSARARWQSHLIHGFLDRNRIDFHKEIIDQLQVFQLQQQNCFLSSTVSSDGFPSAER